MIFKHRFTSGLNKLSTHPQKASENQSEGLLRIKVFFYESNSNFHANWNCPTRQELMLKVTCGILQFY